MNKKTNNKGFTIIEVVIYLGLFAIIIGGTMVTVYQIIQSSQSNNDRIAIQEESNFLLGKINWALTGATSLTITNSPATLLIKKTSSPNITFDQDSNNLRLIIQNDPPVILNSSRISVSDLAFTNVPDSNGITVTMTLSTIDPRHIVTQHFSITKYLKK